MLYCYVQLWVCNWTSCWGNRDVLNRDWRLYLKTTSNFIENLCERKIQRGESKDEVYFWVSSGFLGTCFGKLKISGISMTKSSRKIWSVQYLLVNVLHSAEEKKRRGNPQYKNGFIGNLYQPLKYLLLYLIFSYLSWCNLLLELWNWWRKIWRTNTILKTVLLLSLWVCILDSAWCLPWADNFISVRLHFYVRELTATIGSLKDWGLSILLRQKAP